MVPEWDGYDFLGKMAQGGTNDMAEAPCSRGGDFLTT